jgi:RNA polymerase sigma-70 factor (ECF subfamily)
VDLEEIFRAHQKEVYVYFLRTTGDRDRAEDLAQDTLLRAWDQVPTFRAESSFRTWLFTIARHVLADSYRKTRREVLEDPPDLVMHVDPTSKIAIEEALASLPLIFREAIVLCEVLGMDPSSAAGVVGISPNAFRVRLHRARRGFREAYADA